MTSELKSCPFCGGDMKEHVSAFGLPMFKCENRDCGAIVSFDNDLCNIAAAKRERGPARMAFNTRAERTCRMEHNERKRGVYCSHCGKRMDSFVCNNYGDGTMEYAYPFCCKCGAKVVE